MKFCLIFEPSRTTLDQCSVQTAEATLWNRSHLHWPTKFWSLFLSFFFPDLGSPLLDCFSTPPQNSAEPVLMLVNPRIVRTEEGPGSPPDTMSELILLIFPWCLTSTQIESINQSEASKAMMSSSGLWLKLWINDVAVKLFLLFTF